MIMIAKFHNKKFNFQVSNKRKIKKSIITLKNFINKKFKN